MISDEKFKFEETARDGKRVIRLKGIIDEDATFQTIAAAASKGGPTVFNFNELEAINSCGVRNWVNFLRELHKVEIAFEECPPLVVRQMNMVPSFVGHARVLSVFVPFVCDNCETEKLVLVDHTKFGSAAAATDGLTCDSCKQGEMELDGHPQQYFAFAK